MIISLYNRLIASVFVYCIFCPNLKLLDLLNIWLNLTQCFLIVQWKRKS